MRKPDLQGLRRRLALARDLRRARRAGRRLSARIALVHDFAPPPTGGGHQFLRALKTEWERRGLEVAVNAIPECCEAVLINSYNFRPELLRRLLRRPVRIVHRVDGPLQVYRGFDDGTDALIASLNKEFASASVFQSRFSREENEKLGLGLRDGPVIGNAADPAIFRPRGGAPPARVRRLRVIATSWSDNPNKGLDVFDWLDRNLDTRRFDFTFVGRAQMEFRKLRHIPALPTGELAKLLKQHDVFLTASLNDPCSNSVIEALTVGLPCVYRRSGGHPELVEDGGLGFDRSEEIPDLLERVGGDWCGFRSRIEVPSICKVAEEYLEVLEVEA